MRGGAGWQRTARLETEGARVSAGVPGWAGRCRRPSRPSLAGPRGLGARASERASERTDGAAAAVRAVLQPDPARPSAGREAVADAPRRPTRLRIGRLPTPSHGESRVASPSPLGLRAARSGPPAPCLLCPPSAVGRPEGSLPSHPPSFLLSAGPLPAQSPPNIAVTLSFFSAASPSFRDLCTQPTPSPSSSPGISLPLLIQFFTPGDPLRVGMAAALERALPRVMRTDLPGTTIFHPCPQAGEVGPPIRP